MVTLFKEDGWKQNKMDELIKLSSAKIHKDKIVHWAMISQYTIVFIILGCLKLTSSQLNQKS